MGSSMKNTQSTDICADRIDIILNFAVITNVVIKRVHCIISSLGFSVLMNITHSLVLILPKCDISVYIASSFHFLCMFDSCLVTTTAAFACSSES